MKAVIICLNQKFGSRTGETLAEELNLAYADCDRAISENLAALGIPLQEFTLETLEQNEREVVKTCLKNNIATMTYDLFARHRARVKGDIIYIKLDESKVDKLNQIAYSTRDLRLINIAKYVIKANTIENAVTQIKNTIGEEK